VIHRSKNWREKHLERREIYKDTKKNGMRAKGAEEGTKAEWKSWVDPGGYRKRTKIRKNNEAANLPLAV